MIDETDTRPPPGAETDSGSRAPAVANRKRCAHCQGPFGLIRRRRSGRQFCSIACMVLYVIGIGFLLMIGLAIASLILVIIASIHASKGERYRYPFALRLIK